MVGGVLRQVLLVLLPRVYCQYSLLSVRTLGRLFLFKTNTPKITGKKKNNAALKFILYENINVPVHSQIIRNKADNQKLWDLSMH